MRIGIRAIGLPLGVLFVVCALHLCSPRPARACGCCACDFGGGDVECGDGDTDCGLCIVLGGVPAPTCDACGRDSSCDSQTLCASDPQECSTDITGGCCVPPDGSETRGGCFVMTAAACGNLGAAYRGDNTDCSAPCLFPAPAPAMSPAGFGFAGILLLGIGGIGVARRRARRQRIP